MSSNPAFSLSPERSVKLIDRDLSFLAFNRRILSLSQQSSVPLLERLRYLCIVSSNLDEFFEVRASLHLSASKGDIQNLQYSAESYANLSREAHQLVEDQYRVYNENLIPAFAKKGIHILSHNERLPEQAQWVKKYFDKEVRPLLLPVGLDPAHPFPQVANKSLNFIVRLNGKDALGRHNEIAIVKVPRVLPRLVRLPSKISKNQILLVSLSSIIRAHLKELFVGREVVNFSQFRVTRNSDLSVDEDDVSNLRTALRLSLEHRQYGEAVRLEVSAGCTQYLSDFLLREFDLPTEALYFVHGPVNLVRLNQAIDLVGEPSLLFKPYKASFPLQLNPSHSIFEQISKGDVLFHQPFESFDGVLAFLREAVNDPNVLAIKQTIYRTGSNSELMDLLRQAVIKGKEVTAVVELKARFDEEANINWADRLEQIGAQVVYGVVGLKTHGKMLLVTRREGKHLRHYAHLSTGNYNPVTARLYTDISFLTKDPVITSDVEKVFFHLASQSTLPKLKSIWLAPFELQNKLVTAIDQVAQGVRQGQKGRIVLKMNSLTDERLAYALIQAGRWGVEIDLIVRGACILPAQVPGVSERIKVRSVVGRFLEHTRVFYFRSGEVESLYLSSADWMNRNMLRRIELVWPIKDETLKRRVIDECLVAYLHDTKDAWELQPNGAYTPVVERVSGPALSAQQALMGRYAARRI
jgi:polyphosphate kinase